MSLHTCLQKKRFKKPKKSSENGVLAVTLAPYISAEHELFTTSVVKTFEEVFETVEVLSKEKDTPVETKIVASKKNIEIEWKKFYKLESLDLSKAKIATDDLNPLEEYYLPILFNIISSGKSLNTEYFLTE